MSRLGKPISSKILGKKVYRAPEQLSRGGAFNPNKDAEAPLTGKVQNMKAAQGEERFARTLNKSIRKGLIQKYDFRLTTLKRGTPGFKELDFLVISKGKNMAISVQGTTFVHHGTKAKEQDKINDLIILDALQKMGYSIPRITNVPAESLNTQVNADAAARKLGLYR